MHARILMRRGAACSRALSGSSSGSGSFLQRIRGELDGIHAAGTWKTERVIASPMDSKVTLADGADALNFCANNYLGLSNHPNLLKAARSALETHGFGLSSVRFICGTQDIHKQLEREIAKFHGLDDAILYPSCFDANAGLFEQILGTAQRASPEPL